MSQATLTLEEAKRIIREYTSGCCYAAIELEVHGASFGLYCGKCNATLDGGISLKEVP